MAHQSRDWRHSDQARGRGYRNIDEDQRRSQNAAWDEGEYGPRSANGIGDYGGYGGARSQSEGGSSEYGGGRGGERGQEQWRGSRNDWRDSGESEQQRFGQSDWGQRGPSDWGRSSYASQGSDLGRGQSDWGRGQGQDDWERGARGRSDWGDRGGQGGSDWDRNERSGRGPSTQSGFQGGSQGSFGRGPYERENPFLGNRGFGSGASEYGGGYYGTSGSYGSLGNSGGYYGGNSGLGERQGSQGAYGSRTQFAEEWGEREGGSQGRYGAQGYGGSGSGSSQARDAFSGSSSQQSFRGRGPKGYERSDDRVKEQVCERLSDHDDIDASEITVTVSSGVVTLSGTVGDRREKYHVEETVSRVSGVKDVDNQLRVQSSQFGQSGQSGQSNRGGQSFGSSSSKSASSSDTSTRISDNGQESRGAGGTSSTKKS
jgi:hypothetical protein